MKIKIFKIPVIIGYPAIAAMCLIILLDKNHSIEVCLAAAVIHELGHITAMLLCQCRPAEIAVHLFSVEIIDNGRETRSFKNNLLIIYMGIIFNIIFAILALCFYQISGIILLNRLMMANIVIGAFNLLPVASLDGGQGLFLILLRYFNYKISTIIINVLTVIFLVPFAVIGIMLLMYSKNNFSWLIISIYIVISLILRKEYF